MNVNQPNICKVYEHHPSEHGPSSLPLDWKLMSMGEGSKKRKKKKNEPDVNLCVLRRFSSSGIRYFFANLSLHIHGLPYKSISYTLWGETEKS